MIIKAVVHAMVVGIVLAYLSCAPSPPSDPPGENVSIDFNDPLLLQGVDKPIGSTWSTYGDGGFTIAGTNPESLQHKANMAALDLGYCRVPIRYNGGSPNSGAGGHPNPGVSGRDWVLASKSTNCDPQVVVAGDNTDNDWSTSDAANLVTYFNKNADPADDVKVFLLGNEPSNPGTGWSIGTYCDHFGPAVDAMKAVDATIKVGGPNWSHWSPGTLQAFLQDPDCGPKADIIDWHNYAMGDPATLLDDATLMAGTDAWGDQVATAKSLIATYQPGRTIDVQIGEVNLAWQNADGYTGSCDPNFVWSGEERFFCGTNAVWFSAVLTGVLKAGGRIMQYSDLNGPLGCDIDRASQGAVVGRPTTTPMPVCRALEMFSGPRAPSVYIAHASTTLPDVEVMATRGPNNVYLVNKSPTATQTAVMEFVGNYWTEADVWQYAPDPAATTNPQFDAGVQIMDNAIAFYGLTVTLPPYSVTSITLF